MKASFLQSHIERVSVAATFLALSVVLLNQSFVFNVSNTTPFPDSNRTGTEDNVKAFLATIRYAEGTAGPNGYSMMFTGKRFSSFARHPRQLQCAYYAGKRLCSDAAGAYQFLSTTWQGLGLPDFSPANQDKGAIKLLEQGGIMPLVKAGRFEEAVFKAGRIWASFPCNNGGRSCYGQPVKSINDLKKVYQDNLKTKKQANVNDKTFAYFKEVALNLEFNNADNGIIKKWVNPIKLQVIGQPTSADKETLRVVVGELSELTKLPFEFVSTKDKSNMRIHFVPEQKFAQIVPSYQPGNSGFFWVNWNEAKHITQATILISTTGITQKERSHLIREELTQSMGLMADSQKYPDSIFYQGWTEVNEYSAVDKQVIQMLYDPQVKPGMDEGQLKQPLWG